MRSAEIYVGLMSGTSLDGIDAALVEFSPDGIPRCLSTHFLPYPSNLRSELLAIHSSGNDELRRSALLANRLADLYANATNALLDKAGVAAAAVAAIGCHGQTIRHAPADGYTLQINNPARLVEKTGIAVIADFRNRDIAAGGEGAPLVPGFHDAIFRAPDRHRVIVNIGGIANISDLAPGQPTRGFDCGPGNMLLDAWIARHAGLAYDEGGRWAMQGNVLPNLLARLLANPYFSAVPPKSCGREEFGIAWLDALVDGNEAPADVQSTLVALTATVIVDAISRWCGHPDEIYACGGGAHNQTVIDNLAAGLLGTKVETTDALGLPADWVESVAFAWLAFRTRHGLIGNLPEATGARGGRVLGAIYPA